MLAPPLEMDKAIQLRDQGALLVDARSESEFAAGTIPGALNVPILDDEQRALVGTLHKHEGGDVARTRGIELISPEIPRMVAQVKAVLENPRQPVVVFCWRGGQRSRALCSFLDLAGLSARQLHGGYKAFRRHVLSFFDAAQWGRLLVLRGLTGVGKTALLHRLAAHGLAIVDLERLACHRGSAFGSLGLSEQPPQKMFEALLWDALRKIPPGGFAVTEGESRHIGKLHLPHNLYRALQKETSIWVEAAMPYRVEQILDDYPVETTDASLYARPIAALTERLGKKRVGQMQTMLDESRWRDLVEALMIDYYDPLYRHTLPERRLHVAIDAADGFEQLMTAVETLAQHPTGWSP